jgi:phosphate transport system protein
MKMTSRVIFQTELELLNQEVSKMATLARESVEKAVQCIVEREPELRVDVERLDKEIYSLEQVIEKRCLDLIALHAPVAGDLRTISTCLRMITDLDRIGRYASDIVEGYDDLATANGLIWQVNISHMAGLVVVMVEDAVKAFIEQDPEAARELFERDDEIDCLYDTNFRAVLTYMMEDPRKITGGIHLILIARYLERIADHSCNIGERVVYMVTAERMNPKDRKKAHKLYDACEAMDDPARENYSTHDLEEK